MTTDVSTSLDDSYTAYTQYSTGDEADAKANLVAKNKDWQGSSQGEDPDYAMLVFLTSILQDGSVYDENGKYKQGSGSQISCAQNQLTDVSKQMNVVSSFRNVNADMEATYNAGGTDPNSFTKINSDLTEMDKYVDGKSPESSNTIFDQGTKDSINQAIGTLQQNFKDVQTKYGTLDAFQTAVSNKDDTTGAAGIGQSIGQNIPTITQGCGTVDQTLQSTMEYDKNNITQWTSLLQQSLKTMNAVPGVSIQNQGKGS